MPGRRTAARMRRSRRRCALALISSWKPARPRACWSATSTGCRAPPPPWTPPPSPAPRAGDPRARLEIPPAFTYMGRLMTVAMSIPGHIDPVPVPRPEAADADARVNLIGLAKAEIRAALAGAGLDERQAKLRAKQLWHQIYNRGATSFETMSDIAKPQRAWLAERFEIARPEVV